MIDKLTEVQNYWDSRPCNIRHSNKEFGTKEYFDEIETRKYFIEPHIPSFAEFEKYKDKKVLEIGCGICTSVINFCRSGANVTAVDISQESLNIARKRLQVYGLNAKLYWANAEELSKYVEPEPYDLVYSFGVLHHTPNPEAAFLETKKFMNENSELKLMLYNKASIKSFQILAQNDWDFSNYDKLISDNSEANFGCPVTFVYTEKEIKQKLENIGFEVTDIYCDHIFKWNVEKYVKYEYEIDEIWKDFTDGQFKKLEKKFGWHLMIKAKLK